jgi:hypothetical protein
VQSFVVVATLSLATVRTAAHHSFAAEYDAGKPLILQGTIAKMEWVNPHSWLYVDVKKSDGTVETWKLEFAAPNALYRRGWHKEMLPVGTEVTVTGYQAKDGSSTINATDVTLPDGKKLFAGSTGNGAPDEPR